MVRHNRLPGWPAGGWAAATDVILIFTVNATDKQWSSAKNLLRAVRESFQADAVGRK